MRSQISHFPHRHHAAHTRTTGIFPMNSLRSSLQNFARGSFFKPTFLVSVASLATFVMQSPSATSPSKPTVQIERRPSKERGHADHGWLNSYHTFSFASYYDDRFERFHALRVINEDRVSGGQGFGRHSHREAEIFSYVVSGALHHRDSMNNNEKIGRGEIQFTSAGTGISHSEFNAHDKDPVHFIQIWVTPAVRNLQPSYQTKNFEEKEKLNTLLLTLSPDKSDKTVHINQDIKVCAFIAPLWKLGRC